MSLRIKNIKPLQCPSNPTKFVPWRHMKMGTRAQRELNQLSDAKQKVMK